MNTENLLKNKWTWIIGGIVLLIIIITIGGSEEKSVLKITQLQTVEKPITDKKVANKYSTSVYFNKVINILEDVYDSLEKFQILVSYRDYWTNYDVIEVVKHTLIVEESYEKVKNITPPKDLISTHQEVLKVFKLLKDSMPGFRKALDTHNTKLYNESIVAIQKAMDMLVEITNQFE